MFMVLFGHVLLLTAHVTNSYVINSHADLIDTKPVNLCQPPCSALCSPECLADCCVTKSEVPISAPSPAPAAPAPSPVSQQSGVARQTASCVGVAPGPDGRVPGGKNMMITSVEEGETEECLDKGFHSPTDNSQDPPGTITIPLPDTMYVPPKPGEEPKEIPMPDFPIPAAVLDGKFPEKSIKMEPLVVNQGGIQSGGQVVPQQGPDLSKVSLPCITPPASMTAPPPPPAILPPAPLPPAPASVAAQPTINNQPVVTITPSLHVSPPPPVHPPPPPPPVRIASPPCGVTQTMPSGGTLVYPKLPPVTVSEIPKKKIPPNLLLNKPAIANPLPPPMVHPAAKPLPVCPPTCTGLPCAPGCRDITTSPLQNSQTSQIAAALATAMQNAARVVAPLASAAPAAPAPVSYASPQTTSPSCGSHNADPDSCVINFGPAPSPPALHSYPPADMPTDTEVEVSPAVEVNPTTMTMSLQQAASEMAKMDEKILKEMQEKLTASCVSGK